MQEQAKDPAKREENQKLLLQDEHPTSEERLLIFLDSPIIREAVRPSR